MKPILLSLGVLEIALAVLLTAGDSEDWTRFRGPNGSGVSQSTGFPIQFGRDSNAVWRRPARRGKSSPVLTSRHVFLTAFEKEKLFTLCFDRRNGKLVWEQELDRPRQQDRYTSTLNEPASITPVTDGENVYVFFQDYGLISYDAAGNLRWKVPLGPFSNTVGLGASPVIGAGLIVLQIDQLLDSYIAAFDTRNGEIRWKTPRAEQEGWATPLLYRMGDGMPFVLTAGWGQLGVHLLESGKRVGNAIGLAPVVVASPVVDGDTIFAFGYGIESASFSDELKTLDKNQNGQLSANEFGDDSSVLVSIAKLGGNRDGIVTKEEWDARFRDFYFGPSGLWAFRLEPTAATSSDPSIRLRKLWHYEKNFTGVIPSSLLYKEVLYVLKNGGILTAFEAETGKVLKTGRLEGAVGGYSASPVAAGGKIFLASEDGKIAVIRAGKDWSVLAVNDIGESCYATPALSDGEIYLRTDEALYCFGTHDKRVSAPQRTKPVN
jgi:outer membrane protein assembly factor BamB